MQRSNAVPSSSTATADGGSWVLLQQPPQATPTQQPQQNKVAACAKHFVGDGGTTKGIDELITPAGMGFAISDWQGIDRITSPPHSNYTYFVLESVLACIDVIMIPYNFTEFIYDPLADLSLVNEVGSQAHRNLAREAIRKSLVLLNNGKNGNDSVLPLPKKVSKILVASRHADNLGYQCGGGTIAWQGFRKFK